MSSMRGGSTLFMTSVLGASLLFGAVQAHAAAVSSATASNLTFTLYDLDPTDDVLPSYQLGSLANTAFVSVYANSSSTGSLGSLTAASQPPVERSIDAGGVVVSATAGDGVLSVSGSTFGTTAESNYGASVSLADGDSYWQTTNIELSPHSLLVISMWAEASAMVDQVVCPAQAAADQGVYGCNAQQAAANVLLDLAYSYATPSAKVSASLTDLMSVGGDVTPQQVISWPPGQLPVMTWTVGPGFDKQEARMLSVAFMNVSDEVQTAKLGVNVFAFGSGMLQVPEASSGATMALGLAGVYLVARSRRRVS